MTGSSVKSTVAAAGLLITLVLAGCGGGEQPTATSRPSATQIPSPVPTISRPTATLAAPTPTPSMAAVPTPILVPGKRGGTLQLSVVPSYFLEYDTMTTGGPAAVPSRNAIMNNLLWPDPYNQKVLVGDAAQGWQFSEGGKVITFSLRQNIRFHDGTPLTSKDVVYNFDRGWKPRSPTMTAFKVQFQPIEKIEALDDYTVRLTLSAPSNYLLQALGTPQFLIYPAHFPFPEKLDDFKKTPIGSGPFRVKSQEAQTKLDLERNNQYWKPDLPHLDGITIHGLTGPAVLAAFRTGRLDAVNLDHPFIQNDTEVLIREQGFTRYPITSAAYGPHFNQRSPWTDPRVREAVSLAFDRQAIFNVWLRDKGTAYAAPLLPPELGGQWGISTETMKTRPGYRPDKTADLARAKQLLAEAGVNPAATTVNYIATNQSTERGEAEDASIRALGFKTKLEFLDGGTMTSRAVSGDFDVIISIGSIQVDDPLNYLGPAVATGGARNYGKWSSPEVDRLLGEQDRTLDPLQRKKLLLDLQEQVLKENTTLFEIWAGSWAGNMPWVKNYPGSGPFSWSPKFRWEQVWLDKR